ncbi:MAG: class I SAM-dependent methyltransferase [Planctomycetota bacterium JB042]
MSLPRILEPEVMDTAEEAEAYDHMDHSEVNRLLVDRFVELGGGGRVLDVGTGPAHVPIELVDRGGAASVVAIDAARHMLRTGAAHLARTGAGDRVALVLTDAKRLPLADASCDAVLSNSIVHHLPDPVPCFEEIRRVLRPGGALLLRDLRRPVDVADLERLVATYAADCDDRQRGLFRDSLHAAFTVDEVKEMLGRAGLGDLEVFESSDRHWTAERASAT